MVEYIIDRVKCFEARIRIDQVIMNQENLGIFIDSSGGIDSTKVKFCIMRLLYENNLEIYSENKIYDYNDLQSLTKQISHLKNTEIVVYTTIINMLSDKLESEPAAIQAIIEFDYPLSPPISPSAPVTKNTRSRRKETTTTTSVTESATPSTNISDLDITEEDDEKEEEEPLNVESFHHHQTHQIL